MNNKSVVINKIDQTHEEIKKMSPVLYEKGCCFFSILYACQLQYGVDVTPEEIIRLFTQASGLGAVNPTNAYVIDNLLLINKVFCPFMDGRNGFGKKWCVKPNIGIISYSGAALLNLKKTILFPGQNFSKNAFKNTVVRVEMNVPELARKGLTHFALLDFPRFVEDVNTWGWEIALKEPPILMNSSHYYGQVRSIRKYIFTERG